MCERFVEVLKLLKFLETLLVKCFKIPVIGKAYFLQHKILILVLRSIELFTFIHVYANYFSIFFTSRKFFKFTFLFVIGSFSHLRL